MVEFEILKKSDECNARLGKLSTDHGEIETPVFMPVGTNGTVKGLWQHQLEELKAKIILGNAFHLYLRPGLDVLREFGGLHKFMGWNDSILTDSGGFQVFSLKDKKVLEEGVKFRSPLDGSELFMTPELSMEIQLTVGSDIAMAFDECVESNASREYVEKSLERTNAWARRCLKFHEGNDQALFGIVQGGFFKDLREKSASQITEMNFDGFALGGLSVGEDFSITRKVLSFSVDLLPEDRPRYLMGIGSPDLIIAAIENGIDMFDCVLPTRLGRHGTALTWDGKVNLKAARNKFDDGSVDGQCSCKVCSNYNRGYIHHLLSKDEMLGKILLSYHNISFLIQFVNKIKEAIAQDRFADFKLECFNSGLIKSESFETYQERMG